ncbi:hypothetical protein BH09PLA1_BH09PLA1_37740 [soil metagenome]
MRRDTMRLLSWKNWARKNWSWKSWAGAVAVLAMTTAAQATLLAPGASVGDGVPTSPGSLGVFADTPVLLSQVSTPVATPTYSGTLTSAVYTNAGGTLDFYYQFTNNANSSDGIERL